MKIFEMIRFVNVIKDIYKALLINIVKEAMFTSKDRIY